MNSTHEKILLLREKRMKEYKDMLTFDIAMTENCNMACTYCFAKCNSRENNKEFYFSKDNIDIFLQKIAMYIDKMPNNKIIRFKLYGGEPLIAPNLWYFLEQINLMSEKYTNKFQTIIITNGLALNDFVIQKLNYWQSIFKDALSINFSIDGYKENHDAYRVDKNGNGTFDRIYKNLLKYSNNGENKVTMQAVLTPNLLKNSDLVCEFIRKAKKDMKNITFGLLPMNDATFKEFTHLEIMNLFKQFENTLLDNIDLLEDRTLSLFQFRRVLESLTLTKNDVRTFCALGIYTISIMSNGDIYPCHTFQYDENYNFKIGNINDEEIETLIKKRKSQYLAINTINSKCENCKFGMKNGLGCIGGCVAHNINEYKEFETQDHVCVYNRCFYDITLKILNKYPNIFLKETTKK